MQSSTKAFNKKLTQLWDRFEESVSPAAICKIVHLHRAQQQSTASPALITVFDR